MKTAKPAPPSKPRAYLIPLLLAGILAVLFWKSFVPGYVHFSNDGPLAQQMTEWSKFPAVFTGIWGDLNGIGSSGGSISPNITSMIHWILGPVGYSKFLAPIAMFILGFCAWIFFRQLKLSPLAAALGGLAAGLQSQWLSNACWGVASQQIAVGMTYLALALVISNTPETPWLTRWTRIALAGLAVGVNVMEGADNGAIFSLFIAAFVLLKALLEEGRPVWLKAGSGVMRVVVIAVFAGFIAAQTIVSLIGTSISGVAGTAQTPEAKAAQWGFATQWSLPKVETLQLFVPGLFGYRMDTPKDATWVGDSYKGGAYWGAVGRDIAWDRYFANGRQGPEPGQNQFLRYVGGGNYQGIVLTVIALWAIAQAFRRKNSIFSDVQRKLIWFWAAICVLAILLSWGRWAPFYQFFYALPYSSTIRNPAKFVSVFGWAWLIIFAYGVHGLSCRYLNVPGNHLKSGISEFQGWWKNVRGFDRKWTIASVMIFAMSVVAWLIYVSEKPALVKYLSAMQPPGGDADKIASFSIAQAGWFLLYFAAAILVCILIIAGIFSGKRAKIGGIVLGILLIADFVRGDLPWIVHWNYPVKYATNPIVNFLRDKPYEHRVSDLPFPASPDLSKIDAYLWEELYRIEWIQQLFPYYNIQSLDVVMQPRVATDLEAYLRTVSSLPARYWELSNNRYLLGPMALQIPTQTGAVNVGTLDFLNTYLDPEQKRFRIVQRFDIAPKPGYDLNGSIDLEELTVVTNDNGGCALFEFTGALPRAKLYANWETNTVAEMKNFTTNDLSENDMAIFNNAGTNGFLTLKKLASPSFDPEKTVLLDAPLPVNPTGATNAGTVEIESYHVRDIRLKANVLAPAVLLYNDKYDPHWSVSVDGKPAELLHANFIMRGVYLTPGKHSVRFYFTMPNKPLYITLAAIATAIFLGGLLIVLARRGKKSAQP